MCQSLPWVPEVLFFLARPAVNPLMRKISTSSYGGWEPHLNLPQPLTYRQTGFLQCLFLFIIWYDVSPRWSCLIGKFVSCVSTTPVKIIASVKSFKVVHCCIWKVQFFRRCLCETDKDIYDRGCTLGARGYFEGGKLFRSEAASNKLCVSRVNGSSLKKKPSGTRGIEVVVCVVISGKQDHCLIHFVHEMSKRRGEIRKALRGTECF